MGGLHNHRHAIEQNHLVAPVELIGFARRKAQRDVCRRRRLPALLAPPPGVARGWTARSYSSEVSPDLSTFRTVFRDTLRSRAISLIVLPLMKCSRLIRAIVSTISIPNHLLRYKAGSAIDQSVGGQFWTPIPRLRGSILQAE